MIVKNKSKTAVRMCFSLANELGHLAMHKAVDNDHPDNKEIFNNVEAQASYFAGCFLMPANSFSHENFSPNLSA